MVTDVLPAQAEAHATGKTREATRARDYSFAKASQQLHGGCCTFSGEHPQNPGKQLPSIRK